MAHDNQAEVYEISRCHSFEMLRHNCEPRFHSARPSMTPDEAKLRLPPRIAALHRALRNLQRWQPDDPSGGYWALRDAYEITKNEVAWLFPGVIFVHAEPTFNDTLSPSEELALLTRMTWLFLSEIIRLAYDG